MKTYDNILSFKNDFYKELYEDGIRQRDQINNKFTPTITILTAEIGGIIWIVFKFLKNIETNKNLIYISDLCIFLFLALTIIFMVAAVVHFVLCFTNYNFEYPRPDKVKKFVNDNIGYLGDYSEDEILDNIIKSISNDYIDIAISNDEETNKHSGYLNKCYIWIVAALAFMVVDFVLVLFM